MSKLNNIIALPPNELLFKIISRGMLNWVSDENYLKLIYKIRMKKKLNLYEPSTYNEKLQWLKLYNRNSQHTKLVDKYEVRQYISKELGESYLVPLIGVYEKFEEIDFDKLPKQFVLKCTHDSGGLVICKDKDQLDIEWARKRINKTLKKNYYYWGREWPYKDVKPRIICEQFMFDESGEPPKDYKIFCFNGEPKLIQVDFNRFKGHKQNFYDINWNFRDVSIHCENNKEERLEKPELLDKMLEVSRKLSQGHPHMRVDLYNVNGEVIFGELTFFHMSGMAKFKTESLEVEMGNWLEIGNRYRRENESK